MLFKVIYDYMESSPSGGRWSYKKEVVVYSCSEEELVQYINNFLKDDKCGYRTQISLIDVVRI